MFQLFSLQKSVEDLGRSNYLQILGEVFSFDSIFMCSHKVDPLLHLGTDFVELLLGDELEVFEVRLAATSIVPVGVTFRL